MKALARQALGYAGTGGAAAVVDIVGFHLLAAHLAGVVAPAAASFVAAAVVNYLLSAHWVFGHDWRSAQRAGLFLGFALIGLAINAGTTAWIASAWPVHPTLAKVAGVAVAFGANFLMNARWVFGARTPRTPARRGPQASL